MQIITKAEAIAAGLLRYFTGVPCRNGHVAERRTYEGACILCRRERAREHACRRRADPVGRELRQNSTRKWRASEAGQRWNAEYTKARWATKRGDEEFREGQRQSIRKWLAANREKKSAMDAAWRAANKDKPEFKENQRVRVLNRIAMKRAAPGTYTADDVSALYDRQEGSCACGCGRSIADRRYHIDHIVPLSRGGSNWPDNLQLLAPECNLSKADRIMEEWMAARSVFDGQTASV